MIPRVLSLLFVLLCIVFILSNLFRTSDACRCEVTAKKSFCNNDFVIQAKMTGITEKNETITYRFQIEKVYKKNKAFDNLIWGGRTMYVETGEKSACRIYMEKTLYVVTGRITNGKADVNACDYYAVWKDLTDDIKTGIESTYKQECENEKKNNSTS